MRWRTVNLEQIAEIASGQGAPQGTEDFGDRGTPFIRAGNLEVLINGGHEEDCELVTDDAVRKHKLRLFPADTILFAKSGMSAKLGRIYRIQHSSYVVSHLAAILPSKEVDPSYLQRWFEKNPPSHLIPNDAYPSIRLSDIAKLEIPPPPLPEQRHIAAILDKADAILRKRRRAMQLTENFLRSVFMEMFGDPLTNPRGWPVEQLGKHIAFVTSGSRGWAQHYATRGSRFIRSLDVQMNHISNESAVYIEAPNNAEAVRTKVKPHDVLLTITGSRIGRVATVPEKINEAYISQHVAIIRLKEAIRPRYLSMFLSDRKGGQYQIQRMQYGQTKPGLNLNQIRSFKVPCPPLPEQDKFLAIWDKFDQLALKQQASLESASQAINALTHRAFQCELTSEAADEAFKEAAAG